MLCFWKQNKIHTHTQTKTKLKQTDKKTPPQTPKKPQTKKTPQNPQNQPTNKPQIWPLLYFYLKDLGSFENLDFILGGKLLKETPTKTNQTKRVNEWVGRENVNFTRLCC